MSKADPMLARIEAFNRARGGRMIVQRAARGYSLFRQCAGAPIARLRPTGEGGKVQVLWWSGERWDASGPFGIATMPLDKALDYVAAEPDFWIHTRAENGQRRAQLRLQKPSTAAERWALPDWPTSPLTKSAGFDSLRM